MEIPGLLAATTHAYGLLKALASTIKEQGKNEMLPQVIALNEAVSSMQEKQQELLSRLDDVIKENNRLKQEAQIEAEVTFVNCYYRIPTGKREGNYCQRCWDKDRKLIRLQEAGRSGKSWFCYACEKQFPYDIAICGVA